MSAFCDIWISKDVNPLYERIGCNIWKNEIRQEFVVWKSCGQNSEYIIEHENCKASITVIGQFYEKVQLETLLEQCLAYINNSAKDFNDPSGNYVIFVFLKLEKQLHIFTNRLGTYHVYWSSINNKRVLSTYYLGLAKSATEKKLDWEGITGFMAMGYFPGTTTYLEGISILEPASHYVFDEYIELLKHNVYHQWQHSPVEYPIRELHEELNTILTNSITQATKAKRVALPISGGLDSRLLAGIVTQGNTPLKNVWSYSYGYTENSKETAIALQIAKARQIGFSQFTIQNYLFDEIDLVSDSVELFQYVDGTRQASIVKQLEEHSDVVLCGHWGDVWMNDLSIGTQDPTDWFKNKIIKNGSNWLLKEMCEPHYRRHESFLNNYIDNWNHKYRHIEDVDFRMKMFKTNQWSFRWTLASVRMYQSAVMPVLPFYDCRLVDFFSKVPTHIVKNREFEIEFIKLFYPDLAKIIWQEYDRNLYNYKRYNNRSIIYRGIRKMKAALTHDTPIQRNWEVFYLNDTGRKKLENAILENTALQQVVSRKVLQELIDDFYDNPSAANGYKISQVHTLAQFMKLVF